MSRVCPSVHSMSAAIPDLQVLVSPSPGLACLQHLDCCSCWPHHIVVNLISRAVSHISNMHLNLVSPPWIRLLVHLVKHLTSPFRIYPLVINFADEGPNSKQVGAFSEYCENSVDSSTAPPHHQQPSPSSQARRQQSSGFWEQRPSGSTCQGWEHGSRSVSPPSSVSSYSDSYSEDTDTRLAAALLASLCHGSRLDFLFLTITFFTPLKTIELKKHHLTIYSLTDLSSIDT